MGMYKELKSLSAQEIPQKNSFRYLDLIISEDREIKEDVKCMIRLRWLKWRLAFQVLSDWCMSTRLKGGFL